MWARRMRGRQRTDTQPGGTQHFAAGKFGDPQAGYLSSTEEGGTRMLAAIGLGLVGTVLVVVLVIAMLMFFLRRA